jgi:hypothetical protein
MKSGKVVIYQANDEQAKVEGTFENETLWLSQRVMVSWADNIKYLVSPMKEGFITDILNLQA